MKKRNNIYLKAAIRVANEGGGCCTQIAAINGKHILHCEFTNKFKELFLPTNQEQVEYCTAPTYGYWMRTALETNEQIQTSRILALLFMDLIVNEE